jgi:hypothetical protein
MRAPRTKLASLLLAILLVAATAGPGPAHAAADDGSDGKGAASGTKKNDDGGGGKAKKAGDEKARVFTNADLKRYRSLAKENARPDGAIVVDTKPAEAGAPTEGAISPEAKRLRMAELQAAIDAAGERLAAITALKRSVANPYLAKPKLSGEEEIAFAGKNGIERMKMLEAEEEALHAEVSRVQDEMKALAVAPEIQAPNGGAERNHGEGSAEKEDPARERGEAGRAGNAPEAPSEG